MPFYSCGRGIATWPIYIFGVSPFKNNAHYDEWVGSTDTLTLTLSLLPAAKRKELVTALNWLLQDNYIVNDITSDKDYLIDQYISLTLPFTHLFQEFTRVVSESDAAKGADGAAILELFQSLEKDKSDIFKIVNAATNDLMQYLLARSKNMAD